MSTSTLNSLGIGVIDDGEGLTEIMGGQIPFGPCAAVHHTTLNAC